MNTSEFDNAKEANDGLVQGPLPAGTAAPDFTLYATPDQPLSLRELKGNPVILAFYPADWTSVCGDQLTLYNQLLPTFKEYGAALLGISVDSTWCHQAFAKDRNFHFSLLADFEPKGAVARQYGAYECHLGVCKRALFVIDKEGVVAWSYVSPMAINPGADGILDALDALAISSHSTPTKS
ncbi:redoxin domain-containing protein [Pseudomonas putida]|uniref:redoxin domain-containing protein n=1 Tax=Pseudomonas putida TaxID=303 RepID=UPI0039068A8B